MIVRNKPEVLAPAGSLRSLMCAIDFGADAVYCGGKAFGMRSAAKNLSLEEFTEGAAYAHERGARVYVTLNVLPRNDEVELLRRYIAELARTGIDAVIVSDIGVLLMARSVAPNLEVHVSTQAGVTNYEAARALYELGARRVVLAREMDLQAVRDIRANIPDDMDIECFVHGSMCMAFSGRCLISSYLTGRDANHGECAQACRWKYSLVEEKRPGQYFPVEETRDGTYIFNSEDLNMVDHIDDVIDAGATSLKIEGRAKSAYYVAAMANAYKMAVNEYMYQRGFEDREGNSLKPFEHQVISYEDFEAGRVRPEVWHTAHDSALAQSSMAFSVMPDMEAPHLLNDAGELREQDNSQLTSPTWHHARTIPQEKVKLPAWILNEPNKVAHRNYSTGFYYPEQKVGQNTESSNYVRDWTVVGEVVSWEKDDTEDLGGRLTILCRNKIVPGQLFEVLLPGKEPLVCTLPQDGIRNAKGEPADDVKRCAEQYSFPFAVELPKNAMLRSPLP